MLPAAFVHATLVALDLPRSLAERYAAPDTADSAAARDGHRVPVAPAPVRPAGAPGWPFPLH